MANANTIDSAHESRDVDLTGASRGVWLVKVPKYLAEEWKKTAPNCEVGKLKINKAGAGGGKPEVIFSLTQSAATISAAAAADKPAVPRDHKFVMTGVDKQSQRLYVLSSQTSEPDPDHPQTEKMCVEGRVIQRAECRPLGDASYMRLKRNHFEISNKPTNEVKQLKRAVINYKPVSAHTSNIAQPEVKKKERQPKDRVTDMLFSAFEKHQYYNVKDLVRITQQPITYLKEILNEICSYNMKAPHKNMWELKTEYRHYKDDTTK